MKYPHGLVCVMAGQIDRGARARAGATNCWALPSGVDSSIALAKKGSVWHKVSFLKRGNVATLTVDDRRPLTIDIAVLRTKDEKLRALGLEGLLGIWVQNGFGEFRKGEVTPLGRPPTS